MNDTTVASMWSRGSYGIVGDWFAAASRACVDDLQLAGTHVLDVACGTGAVAIEAARRGAHVIGVDITPSMLEEAAQRAKQAGVDVRWQLGSFEDLSEFSGFDVVTSAFGVMFAADQPAVARELVRSLRPGGMLSLAAWSPDSAFGTLPEGFAALLPAVADGPDHTRWATRPGLTAIFGHTDAAVVDLSTHTLAVPFASVEDAVAQMRRWSGPWMHLFDVLKAQGTAATGHRMLVDHLSRYTRADGDRVALEAAYGVGRLRRPGPHG